MLRHYSVGPAALVALMGAWHAQPAAVEPRVRWIVAFDGVFEDDDRRETSDARKPDGRGTAAGA